MDIAECWVGGGVGQNDDEEILNLDLDITLDSDLTLDLDST